MRKLYMAVVLGLITIGCTATIDIVPNVDRRLLSIEDRRTPRQKESRRDSVFLAVRVLSEDDVEPPAILIFQDLLQRHQRPIVKLELVVDDFAIIDFYPRRSASTRGSGWLNNLNFQKLIASNTDWSYIEKADLPANTDFIICVFSGSINGKPIQTAKYSAYQISSLAGAVRHQKEFLDAILNAIDQVAQDSVARITMLEETQD